MIQSFISRVLLGPVVSEKTTLAGERNNVVAFWVSSDASKEQVKIAVESIFDVTVEAVNTLKKKGKAVRFGKTKGRSKAKKKAYVTLADGSNIDFEGEK